ncbi:MAG: hypothetical protein PHS07_01430 [Patescibacteria group bacterium]|nr:hypothetical protein [Patescibacteria group bacterium]
MFITIIMLGSVFGAKPVFEINTETGKNILDIYNVRMKFERTEDENSLYTCYRVLLEKNVIERRYVRFTIEKKTTFGYTEEILLDVELRGNSHQADQQVEGFFKVDPGTRIKVSVASALTDREWLRIESSSNRGRGKVFRHELPVVVYINVD